MQLKKESEQTMKKICKITGIKNEGKYIKILYKSDHVKNKPGVMEAIKDLNAFQDQMQQQMILSKEPEMIRVPVDEYKKHRYSLGDTFTLDMMPGGT